MNQMTNGRGSMGRPGSDLPMQSGTLALQSQLQDVINALVEGGVIREHQVSVAIATDALTNINGKVLTNFSAADTEIGGYPAKVILTDEQANLNAEQAARYMKAQTGSDYVPIYDYDHPTNSYIMFADKTLWKPQFLEGSYGLVLFSMNSTLIDAESAQKITSAKTIKGYALSFTNNGEASTWGLQRAASDQLSVLQGGVTKYYFSGTSFVGGGNDLGSSTSGNQWKDLYLSGNMNFYDSVNSRTFKMEMNTTYSRLNFINGYNSLVGYIAYNTGFTFTESTVFNKDASFISGANTYSLLADGAWFKLKYGNSAIYEFYDSIFKPSQNNHTDLGTSSAKWKDLYLSGKAYEKAIVADSSDDFTIYHSNGTSKALVIGTSNGTSKSLYTFVPTNNNSVNLGSSSAKWKNVYVAGSITDGTNSFSPSQIANLIKINALNVYADDFGGITVPMPFTVSSLSLGHSDAVVDNSKMRIKLIAGKTIRQENSLLGVASDYTYPSASTSNVYIYNGGVDTSYGNGNVPIISGHVYALIIKTTMATPDTTTGNYSTGIFRVSPAGAIGNNTVGYYDGGYITSVITATDSTNAANFYMRNTGNGFAASDKIKAMAIDLTFNGDESLTAEQAFKKYASKFNEWTSTAHSQGLKNSTIFSISSAGQNLISGQNMEVGWINNGTDMALNYCVRTRDATYVSPNTAYCFSVKTDYHLISVAEYDSNGAYVQQTQGGSNVSKVNFTTSPLTACIRVAFARKGNLQIIAIPSPTETQLSLRKGSDVTAYVPYVNPSYLLNIPCTAYCANGVGYSHDELNFETKSATTRCAEVDLGSLTWNYAGGNIFYASLADSDSVADNVKSTLLCSKYVTVRRNDLADKTVCVSGTDIIIKDVDYSSAATFKTAMSGVTVVYELIGTAYIDEDLSAMGDLGDFSPYIPITIGGTVDCDSEVKPEFDAYEAVYGLA